MQCAIVSFSLRYWPVIDDRKGPVLLAKKGTAFGWKWRSAIHKTLLSGIRDLCHVPVGVTSNIYCNRKYCTFTVTSTVMSYLRRVHRTVYNKVICNVLGSVI